MAKGRVSKAQKAFREASDLTTEKLLELRAAEAAHKRMRQRLRQLALSPVGLSKEQEAEFRKAADAHSAAHERMRLARKEWLAAIDRFCTTAEATTSRRRPHKPAP